MKNQHPYPALHNTSELNMVVRSIRATPPRHASAPLPSRDRQGAVLHGPRLQNRARAASGHTQIMTLCLEIATPATIRFGEMTQDGPGNSDL